MQQGTTISGSLESTEVLKFSFLKTFAFLSFLDFFIAQLVFLAHNVAAVSLKAKAARLVFTSKTLTVQTEFVKLNSG